MEIRDLNYNVALANCDVDLGVLSVKPNIRIPHVINVLLDVGVECRFSVEKQNHQKTKASNFVTYYHNYPNLTDHIAKTILTKVLKSRKLDQIFGFPRSYVEIKRRRKFSAKLDVIF